MRHTRSHTRNRRSHHTLKSSSFSVCGKCGAATRPHAMCENCGMYRGRVVIDVLAKLDKKKRKQKEKTLQGEQTKTQTKI